MSRKLPPLNTLRVFDAAARYLSFTRAAAELFVTQAAVSHQIKALEEFLGVKLFLRQNRMLTLTPEGQAYRPTIRRIFQQLSEATERLKMSGTNGSLTVGVVPTFAVMWLVPRLSLFSELYPDIDVRMKSCDALVDFVRDDLDLQIVFGRRTDYPLNLHVECLLDEYLVPVCAPELVSGEKPLNTPSDLAYHTLLHDESTDNWRHWLELAGANSVDSSHGPIFSHSNMVLQAARYGQGIAIGHSVLAQSDVQSGRLIRPFDIVLPTGYSYDVVCPETWADRPRIEAFRCWLVEMVATEQARDAFTSALHRSEAQ